jgi:membrane associated rhomboid family serine protease
MPSRFQRGRRSSFLGSIPPGLKYILIALGVVSIGTALLKALNSTGLGDLLEEQLVFRPSDVLHGKLWQLVTYPFFTRDPISLLISALMLWMFAGTLERRWGIRRFLTFFFSAVVIAAVLTTVVLLPFPSMRAIPHAGMWTAIEAFCAAYALSFPNDQILLMFVVPIQARYLIHLAVGITVLFVIMGAGPLASYLTPFFGLLAGIALMSRTARPRQILLRMRVWWIDRKLKARKLRVIRGIPDDDELPQARSGGRGSDGFLH